MKKALTVVLSVVMCAAVLASCGGSTTVTQTKTVTETKTVTVTESGDKPTTTTTKTYDDTPEVTKVRWNYGLSGNILVTLAQEFGYFKEYGIELEFVQASAVLDQMTLLSTNQVDIVSNPGTSVPLQSISAGQPFTIFGGHMVNGCMPIIALKDTEWKGIESFVGEKVAVNPSYFALTGAVMDLGYDNPLEVCDWIIYPNYNDALAAVVKGEVKYALQGTGQNYAVKNRDDIKIVAYQSDIMNYYSCCRMVCRTDFIEKNPNTIKCILKALLRAQSWYEAHRTEVAAIQAKALGTTEDYINAFLLDERHYVLNVDPLRNSVVRAWGILDKTGFLKDEAKQINIDDHINTDIYYQALIEAQEQYGSEDPAFYERQLQFFNENDK